MGQELGKEPSGDAYYLYGQAEKEKFKQFSRLGRHSILFAENGFDTYSIDLSQYGIYLKILSQSRLDI